MIFFFFRIKIKQKLSNKNFRKKRRIVLLYDKWKKIFTSYLNLKSNYLFKIVTHYCGCTAEKIIIY